MGAFRHTRLTLPIAQLVAVAVWIAIALSVAAIPPEWLDRAAIATGLPSLFAVAQPPLGFTARLVLILVGGGVPALACWLILRRVVGARALVVRLPQRMTDEAMPLRRADAHPDAPSREPLFAHRDLGTPFLDIRAQADADGDPETLPTVEHCLPADLDQPLAAFDPAAIPEHPRAPVPTVAPLARIEPRPTRFGPGERIETFELTPLHRPQPASPADTPMTGPETRETITALLARLERGLARRVADGTVMAVSSPR